jgi:hypothetical protein
LRIVRRRIGRPKRSVLSVTFIAGVQHASPSSNGFANTGARVVLIVLDCVGDKLPSLEGFAFKRNGKPAEYLKGIKSSSQRALHEQPHSAVAQMVNTSTLNRSAGKPH